MKRYAKHTREPISNEYLNFIKRNHLRLLSDDAPNKLIPVRSKSKAEDTHPADISIRPLLPNNPDKTLTIEIEEPNNDEVFPLGFNGNNFSSYRSQPKKTNEVKLSNADIQSIIEDKRQNIMKIVYESVQISINSKKVLLKPEKSLLKGHKKSIVKLLNLEKQVNDQKQTTSLKLPDISKKEQDKQLVSDDPSQAQTICYNDYIKQNYLDTKIVSSIDRKMSQQLPAATRRKKLSVPQSRRYEQHEKLIQTFYEYERLMQMKELKMQQEKMKQQHQREHSHMDRLKERQNKLERLVALENQRMPISPSRRLFVKEEKIEEQVDHKKELQQSMLLERAEEAPGIRFNNMPKEEDAIDTEFSNLMQVSTSSPNKKTNSKIPAKPKLVVREKEMTVYEHKISTYRDFIFKINLAHGRYDSLDLKEEFNCHKNDNKYRAYIGRGNNSLLIKSLLKRRYWWTIEDDHKTANFIWTQLKINSVFDRQKPCEICHALQVKVVEDDNLKKHKGSKKDKTQKSKPKLKPEVPAGNCKALNVEDQKIIEAFEYLQLDPMKLEDYDYRMKFINKSLLPAEEPRSIVLHNHLECNFYIGNKKAMFYNMRQYYSLTGKDVFDFLPLTFHIKKGMDDKEYKNFVKYFKKREQFIKACERQEEEDEEKGKKKKKHRRKPHNIWIVKPGEISNRGNGITVIDEIYELNKIVKSKQKHVNGNDKTYIVQEYLDRPLLYNRRKFDIRHYMLITTLYGRMKAYWYSEGYIRTSSCEFTLNDLTEPMIHLTNDAIQKYGPMYGKYEQGNKLSYAEFQRYLDQHFSEQKYSFYDTIYPKMKQIATDAVRSAYIRLDPRKLQHNFEVFGLDFMIDVDFNVWLIEINTNPCLEISSGLLGRIIPTMVEHAMRLSLDVLFPPVAHYPNTQKHLAPDNAMDNLKFELIFDEQTDGHELKELYKNNMGLDCGEIEDDEEVYDNEGKEYDQDII